MHNYYASTHAALFLLFILPIIKIETDTKNGNCIELSFTWWIFNEHKFKIYNLD